MILGNSTAQEKSNYTLFGKISQEYRTNFFRLHDSTKVDDYRTNFYFSVANKRRIWNSSRLDLTYELRHRSYDEYEEYGRNDHQGSVKLQKPVTNKWRFTLSNEMRLRQSRTTNFSYLRNIAHIYTNLEITPQNQAYFGMQHWSKDYYKSSLYQRYNSVRLYAKINLQLNITTNLSIHSEYNHHEGNLYPGSKGEDLELELNGHRFIFISRVDKILYRKLFATFAYRFENDFPAEVENELTGQHFNDENYDELLAEDSDFGYFKNQFSVSSLWKVSPGFSLMAFYNLYVKEFKFWRISSTGPERSDRLIFISHIFKLNFNTNYALELRHIYEENHTNFSLFQYKMNAISAGLSVQF
ncbi:MAG: hypothetical protein DWQ10_13545 [Calditrichaeota bacterium]|nr:MAG: hypothetical protein DWQ10_13545 [Calditrichota bacterium]